MSDRFAIVRGMADEYEDPSGSTMAFRAYMNRQEQGQEEQQAPAPAKSNLPLIIGAAVAVVAVVGVLLFLVL